MRRVSTLARGLAQTRFDRSVYQATAPFINSNIGHLKGKHHRFSCIGISSEGLLNFQHSQSRRHNCAANSRNFSHRTFTAATNIMGQGVVVDDQGRIVNRNPATGEVISYVPCTPLDELDKMVANAKEASTSWSAMEPSERIRLLKKGIENISKQSDRLQKMIVQEMGKPLQEAMEEVEGALDKDEYLKILESSLQPQTRGSSVVVRQPLGTVAVLSPWNFPCDEILFLLLPALGSGNTAIVKPSEVSPETGAIVVNAIASALPKNVVQLAQGDGSVGAHLVKHEGVDMICMTGSSATGKKILESAAPKMKRLVLELGGKDPMVVMEDADLEKAASDAVQYSLSNSGQVCCSIERVYVANSIYPEFQKLVAKYAADYKVGNGLEEGIKVGPLVSKNQRDIVASHVDDALKKGAKLVHKSGIPEDASEDSSFYPVTVLADVTKEMDVNRKETFGPVVALSPFDGTEEEAIRLANDTEYGLSGAVYSRDEEKAMRVASRIDAGQIGINCYAMDNMDVACPWVGHKHSGFGYHSGVEGFNNFSVPKTLVYKPSE